MNNICIRHVYKRYGDKAVLENVSFCLRPGITCLMAPSGTGKTTLLRLLLGLEKPDSGEISGFPARAGVLFQEDRLVESLSVRANLKLALGATYDAARALALLDTLGLQNEFSAPVCTLSGGMKRRVALSRALLFDGEAMLLDEPFKGLDDQSRLRAQAAVLAAAKGRVTLVITHDPQDCAALGGQVLHL